ncbi:hypothetical protein Efla_004998 [Eimeria flavescens]
MAGEAETTAKYQNLLADRELLTSLMESAANGKLQDFLSVTKRVEERYGLRGEEGGSSGAKADLLLGFKDGNGRSVAHFAALGGCLEILQEVLRRSPAASKARDKHGKTPLCVAAGRGHLEVMQLLLAADAEADAEAEGGSTALHEAVYEGQAAAVKLLLDRGATVDKFSSVGTPLQIAAVTLNLEVMDLLLKAGADPNKPASPLGCPGGFPPPLILAASKNATDAVRLLLSSGADPHCFDAEGFTPLHCAAENDALACAQLLLEYGADWGAVARDGTTPLDLARRHHAESVAKQLEALGVNRNPKRPFVCSSSSEAAPPPAGTREATDEADSSLVRVVIDLEAEVPFSKEQQKKVEKLKDEGNAAFRRSDFCAAADKYSQAIEACPLAEAARPLLAALYSNRSFSRENLKDAKGAMHDALAATHLRPHWSKAHYRLARAYRLFNNAEEHIAELWFALRLDPSNEQIRDEIQQAVLEARAAKAAQPDPPA